MSDHDERAGAGDDRPDEQPDAPPTPGRMRQQDPATTTPREPTLAEQRARQQAQKRSEDERRAADDEAERSRRKRKRLLIGAGVTVGVVAVVAIGYAVATADDEVSARCTGDDGMVVDDSNCVTPASSSTSYHNGGIGYPIFIGGGGRQYHYTYGGSGDIGQRVSGGTTVEPRKGTTVRTGSGRTISGSSGSSGSSGDSAASGSSTSRGGLGVSNSGSSSGS